MRLNFFTKYTILLFFACGTSVASFSQVPTRLRGQVVDEASGAGIPYADARIKGSSKATFANDSGYFSISGGALPLTLIISSVGYEPKEVVVESAQGLHRVALRVQVTQLSEVRIRPRENPAHTIMRKVIKNKDRNNPDNINAYKLNVYQKTLGQLKNIDSAWVEEYAALRSLQKSMIKQPDSLPRYTIPLLFSEEVKQEVLSRNPYISYSIPEVARKSGLSVFEEASLFSDYVDIFSRELNFYNDNIVINAAPMLSPISSLAFAYYNFWLHPDTMRDSETGLRLMRIKFLPKNPRNAVFMGELTVYDSIYAIKNISAKLSPLSNVPFIIRYEARVSYMLLRDSTQLRPFVQSSNLEADYHFLKLKDGKDHAVANIRLHNSYSDVQLNPPLSKIVEDEKTLAAAQKISEEQMNPLRKDSLSSVEKEAMVAMSELNKVGWVAFANRAAIVLGSGYYNAGKVDFGPYGEVLKLNGAEGVRINLPMRTSNTFHPNFFADGMVGFGTKDAKAKCSLDMGWKFNTRLRKVVKVGGEYNSFRVGGNEAHFALLKENSLVLSEDLLWFSIFSVQLDDKYTTRYGGYVGYEREWRRWISSTITYSSYNIESSQYTPFTHEGNPVSVINQQELSLHLRLSSDSELRSDFFARRIYMSNSNLPIVHPILSLGSYYLRGVGYQGYYAKLHLAVKQRISLGTTMLRYVFEGGAILGAVPFPLLEGHRSIESFMFAPYKFNLLYNLTLASDRYASLMLEYNLNGLLLNRIPLIRSLNLKEMFNCKILYNFQDVAKHSKVLDAPGYIYARNSAKPYVEIGTGIQNIFQVLGVGCVWRVPMGEPKDLPYAYTDFSVVLKVSFGK